MTTYDDIEAKNRKSNAEESVSMMEAQLDATLVHNDELRTELAAANERIKWLEAENAALVAINTTYKGLLREEIDHRFRIGDKYISARTAFYKVVKIARHWRGVAHGEI